VFRERRRERQEEREATHYQMRQRMISIGDDYVIENDRGERVFKLDGKALRVRKTIQFEDMDGQLPGENDALILAATAVTDTMAHPDR
jgi:hypothetical protein